MVLDPNVPHVAYFVGLAQTDGHHSGDLRGKGRLEIELSARDAAVLERLAALLPCYASVGRRTRTTNFSRSRVHETAILRIYDRTVRRELAALGVVVGPKSDKVAPPPVPCSRTDYWRGVVDGDGSLGFTAAGRPFVSLVSASPALTQGFADLLHDVTGAVRTPRPNTRDGVVNLMVQSNEAAALARWLYPDGCELALTRSATRPRASGRGGPRRAASTVTAFGRGPGRRRTTRSSWIPA